MSVRQSEVDPGQLTQQLKAAATELGFRRAMATPATEPARLAQFNAWLDNGYAGEMHYLSDRREAYQHPSSVLEGAQSLLMLVMDYASDEPNDAPLGHGRVSRYAWGDVDYHDLAHPKLKTLVRRAKEWAPNCAARGVIDTAPLLERDFAKQAGLGWVGKNTLLLDPGGGSLFFLAALLLDVPLEYDEPFETEHCGTCTACLDACPTDAFPQPYVLDATRCISYLTIELRDAIPLELRAGVGDWLFGCDVCQDVCPWNRHAQPSHETSLASRGDRNPQSLTPLFSMTDAEFREQFRKSPLWRPRRRGILRNAAIVLGNQKDPSAIDALARGLDDEEGVVRGASAWALGNIGGAEAQALLQQRARHESDEAVQEEIRWAIDACCGEASS